MVSRLPTIAVALLTACWVGVGSTTSQAGNTSRAGGEGIGDKAVPSIFDGDLRDLPRVPAWQPGDPIREIPKLAHPAQSPLTEAHVDDPLMARGKSLVPTRGTDFDVLVNEPGLGFNGAQPPDPDGDVGVDYFIQMINSLDGSVFAVYDKNDVAAGPLAGPTLLASLGVGDCAAGFRDPIVLYDELAGRWLLSETSFESNAVCLYTSRTADPVTGGWCAYQFDMAEFPDYPKYGVSAGAIVMTANESSPPPPQTDQFRPIYAFDRANMYSADGTTCPTARPLQRVEVDRLPAFGFQTLTPADHDGAAPQPGAPAYFMRHRDTEAHGPVGLPDEDQLELWELTVDFDVPANTVLAGPQIIAISEFSSNLCGFVFFDCLHQPGGPDLDPLREVIMNRLQYRNNDGHERLVGNMVTNTDAAASGADDAGVRWFELRRNGGPWSLHQEGTIGVDDENRWMAATSMDVEGNIVAAYVHTSAAPGDFPSHRFSGRLRSDPPGTMPRGEETLVDGADNNDSSRYGDYSSMTVDPVDGCTFWWTGEYNPAASWATRIGAFRFASCGVPIFADGFESGDTSAWSNTIP